MKYPFDLKQASRLLQKNIPQFFPDFGKPKLSVCQEVMARALKFRDFHEAQSVLLKEPDPLAKIKSNFATPTAVAIATPSATERLKNELYFAFYESTHIPMPDLKEINDKSVNSAAAKKFSDMLRTGVFKPELFPHPERPDWNPEETVLPLLHLIGDSIEDKSLPALLDKDAMANRIISFCLRTIPAPFREASWRIQTAKHDHLRTLALGMIEEARRFVFFSAHQMTDVKWKIQTPVDQVFWLAILSMGAASVPVSTVPLLQHYEFEKTLWDRLCAGEISKAEQRQKRRVAEGGAA